jgi:serine/threonine protein phosphatase PrpC
MTENPTDQKGAPETKVENPLVEKLQGLLNQSLKFKLPDGRIMYGVLLGVDENMAVFEYMGKEVEVEAARFAEVLELNNVNLKPELPEFNQVLFSKVIFVGAKVKFPEGFDYGDFTVSVINDDSIQLVSSKDEEKSVIVPKDKFTQLYDNNVPPMSSRAEESGVLTVETPMYGVCAGITNTGGRDYQEDGFYVSASGRYLFVLDGMGGVVSSKDPTVKVGGIATELALNTASNFVNEAEPIQYFRDHVRLVYGSHELLKFGGGACFVAGQYMVRDEKLNLDVSRGGDVRIMVYNLANQTVSVSIDKISEEVDPRNGKKVFAVINPITATPREETLENYEVEPGSVVFIMSDGVTNFIDAQGLAKMLEDANYSISAFMQTLTTFLKTQNTANPRSADNFTFVISDPYKILKP